MLQINPSHRRNALALVLGATLVLSLVLVPQAMAQDPCVVDDNGSGTVTLPPEGCPYLSPDQVHEIINGLPPGTTIIVQPIHGGFLCNKNRESGCEIPGGPLGGNEENFDSTLDLHLSGTGKLAGWRHTVSVPATVRTFTGPRNPGDDVQEFETEMDSIVSADHSDSEFAHFKIVGGTANGFPSPGKTVLTRIDDNSFEVDSQFQVGYQIEFQGAPGSRLEGFAGATEGTVHMTAVAGPSVSDTTTANTP